MSLASRCFPSRLSVLSLIAGCALFAAGCASPTGQLHALAERQGFERRVVASNGFDLTVFENAPAGERSRVHGDVLHVYLEGDGSPWTNRVFVMPDPTPRQPLMLRLMALDTVPAIYVGRPCYNGTAESPGCDSTLWTSARYSAAVADSMAAAVRATALRRGFGSVRLFGHSGGGTLALLLAARLPGTLDVVTLAGNLDPDAWTDHHRYSPLHASLNPAREPPLDASIEQWHLLGERDTVVPPAIVLPFIRAQPSAIGAAFATFDHGCCWQRVWEGVLRAVVSGRAALLPGRVIGSTVSSARRREDGRGDR